MVTLVKKSKASSLRSEKVGHLRFAQRRVLAEPAEEQSIAEMELRLKLLLKFS